MERNYQCKICNKFYSSQSSFCNHNKKFHPGITSSKWAEKDNFGQSLPKKDTKMTNSLPENTSVNTCEYCDKILSSMRSLRRHHLTCKKKQNIILENEQLRTEINNMKIETDRRFDEFTKIINDLINKNCKMHYKTLQKINNSGTMNNGTINNTINIMALGQENIDEVLSKTDKIAILNKKENALPYMIEMVHFNDKYPQFKNIAITNNRTKQAYVYDTVGKVFKMVDKEELIEELIDYRVCDIEDYYMQYKDELEIPVKHKIDELIEHRGEDDITKDKIKLLLFNNRHKIKV